MEPQEKKFQEMQFLEQNLQNILMQKQAFQMESGETDHVVKEVEKAEGEISKIIGNQVVIKSTKEKVLEEMKHKKELIDLRLKNIDKQEKEFSEKIESIRDDVMKKLGAK